MIQQLGIINSLGSINYRAYQDNTQTFVMLLLTDKEQHGSIRVQQSSSVKA